MPIPPFTGVPGVLNASTSGDTMLVFSTPPRSKNDDCVVIGSTAPRSNPAVQLIAIDASGKGKKKVLENGDSRCPPLNAKVPQSRLSSAEKGKSISIEKSFAVPAILPSLASSSDARCPDVLHDLQSMSLDEEDVEDTSDDAFVDAPPQRMARRGRNYDRNWRYHCEWSAKFTWAEGVVGNGVHFVKCRICSDVDGQPKLMTPKLDTLNKHEGHRKVLHKPTTLSFSCF